MEFESSSSTSGRPLDLHAICRLCLSDRKDSLKSIYDEVLGPNRVPQKIELLIQIQISKHDKLSTMVCNDCIIRLDTWFSYKRQCHRNQTKLAEWLNITKAAGSELNEMTLHIKQEPTDPPHLGYLPVKVELNHDDEEYDDMNVSGYHPFSNDQLYLDDLDINALETDDDRRCPDCGKMFGSAQNRRRHQNMMHAKKERRAQMMEIRSPFNRGQNHSQSICNVKSESQEGQSETKHEPSNSSDTTVTTTESNASNNPENESNPADQQENPQKESRETNGPINDSHAEKAENVDTSDAHPNEDMETDEKTGDSNPPVKEEPTEKNNDETSQTGEKSNEENREENREIDTQEDEKKIQFAAGLQLVQKDQTSIELESLSKIELSYIEKCKAMVSMFHTLQCACHNVQHKTLRYLLSHLRETRIWFPLFTCYNCMISLTDRSTFTRHHSRCPKPQLETLIKLSNLRKRSEVKSRLYQNFKCNRCKFLFSFHEDFCKHIDEDHAYGSPPFYCSCRYVFDSLEEYKTHCYTSCILSYYCDICFITTSTLEEFIKHSEEAHDNSEGFVLLQENTYVPRNHTYRHKEADDESNVLEGKRERRRSVKEPIMVQIYDREIPPDLKEIPTRVIKKILQLDKVPVSAETLNRSGAQCPLCKKQYSSVNNMMRHYRSHIERKEIELPKFEDETGTENEDLYTCPDCGGVYPSSKWSSHLEEKHPTKSCSECEKEFQFQSELDQHRSVHLNLKVFRDSKTQNYKSAMVSPTSEMDGDEVMVACEICDAMFNSKEELRHHKMSEHDSGSRSGASDDIDNMEMSVDDEPLLDVESYEEVNEKDEGNETATSQSPVVEKPYCEYCDKPFASAKSLREHVINKHGAEYLKKSEYPKQCELCDRVLSTGSGFKLHMQMHNRINSENEKSEFPKKCEYCDKVCTTGAALYVHTQMHERVTLGELKKKKEDRKKPDSSKPQDEEESYHTCKRCFKVFGTRGKLKEHMKCHGFSNKSSPKKNRKVLCDLCHVAVENHEALAKHKAEEHSDELDGMPTIKTEMDVDEDSQDTNTTDSTPSIIYACDICEKTFSSKPELRSHKESHSQPKNKNMSLTCKYCRITFESINGLTKHMHTEHDESAKPKTTKESKYRVDDGSDKPYKCPICNKGFATLGAMTTHTGWHKRGINKGASQNTPQAEAAAKLAKKEKVLKKITAAVSCKQEPIDAPEYQCSTCLMELPNETALQIHVLEKHGSLDARMLVPRCNTCNQDFKSQEEYETHKRFHDFLERQKRQEQQMQTPVIQSVQSVSDQTQSTPKKFPCSWCSSVFSRQDTLNTHIKNHHKEHVKTEFECPECNRIFDKQNSLTIHLKTHQKQKTASAQASNVNHAIVGGIGKVYVCSLCNMGFSFPKDLRMHTINAHPF